MHPLSILLTTVPQISLSTATGADFPSLSIENIRFSSYYLMVSPSAQGPRQGLIDFTIINSAVEVAITCSAKNSNSFAIFNPSTTYECDFAPAGGEEGGDDDWCWSNSATFNFDTTKQDVYNLTVQMSWTCEK
ncbi:hypothetical protein G6011_04409 [Alternaria panax]|uniref:AA1-like domain-containing protein n=1 Tax=Alternaria panax TaxID=48097 RepID=A0AAD4IHC7_9PLEO|nr:hypothetical protein G6011_04409 [Alternaria panax]